jgi:NAD(P)-dependent dehydrogenase (short-subunit alcohol dehydrogenase family)
VALPGDIRSEAFCQSVVDQAVSGLGGLDILVNNAGRRQSHDSILDISTEQFDWTLRTNL